MDWVTPLPMTNPGRTGEREEKSQPPQWKRHSKYHTGTCGATIGLFPGVGHSMRSRGRLDSDVRTPGLGSQLGWAARLRVRLCRSAPNGMAASCQSAGRLPSGCLSASLPTGMPVCQYATHPKSNRVIRSRRLPVPGPPPSPHPSFVVCAKGG